MLFHQDHLQEVGMSKRLIEKFLNDLEAVKKEAVEAALTVSTDFTEDDLDYITQISYLKAWENKGYYEGKPKPHLWFSKIAQKKASDLLIKIRRSEVEERRAIIPEASLDEEYGREKFESMPGDEAYKTAINYIDKYGLFLEEERLIAIAMGIAAKRSPLMERDLIQMAETTCQLYSGYLKASRETMSGKLGTEERDKHLDLLRIFNERNHGIPETYLNALTDDWNSILLMVSLCPRLLLTDYEDKGYFKIIREQILFRMYLILTRADSGCKELSREEMKIQRENFEEICASKHSSRIPSVALQFLLGSFRHLYQAVIEVPYSLNDVTRSPDPLKEIMANTPQSERITLNSPDWEESQRAVTERMWKTYAKEHPKKYGGNQTAISMAYHMTSKTLGISKDTIRKRIKSIDQI
jgi:DNA-directed RNA polymerase specialized sigma24 family protein